MAALPLLIGCNVTLPLDMTAKRTRILVAPDKFKGALSAREAAENIAAGIRAVSPEAIIEIVPMADGGEGTAEVICQALEGSWFTCNAHDPFGREIGARYAWINNRNLAVMEMSEAAGMRRLSPNELDPERASTFGVGEMILDAANRGAEEIMIGLGGSATNDGGAGMARALGIRFIAENKELTGLVSELENLTRIALPSPGAARSRLPEGEDKGEGTPLSVFGASLVKITAAVDVRNPLLGMNGATQVFGPQKGATPDNIPKLEHALARLADVVAQQFHFDFRDQPGAGAAGGLGFGLMSFCGAAIRPGFELVADLTKLESKIANADLVITGEGCLDRQTLSGKAPFGIAKLARKHGKRVISMVGRANEDKEARDLFDHVCIISDAERPERENIARAGELLSAAATAMAKRFNISPSRTSNRT